MASESVSAIMTTSAPSTSATGTSSSSTPTHTRAPSNPTLFSPGASPPLILAFLAIGLFTISMVAVFGWRRVQLGRGAALHPFGNDEIEFGERRRGFGERPKLWDLWTDRTAAGSERDVGWDAMMPVAVMEVPGATTTHTPRPTPARNPSTRHRMWPLHTASIDSDVKAEPVPPVYTHLQVAVAIAMPSLHLHDKHTDYEHQPADDAGAQVNYTIGLYHYAGHGRGEG